MQADHPTAPHAGAAQRAYATAPRTDGSRPVAGHAVDPGELHRVADPSHAPAGATAFVTGAYQPSGNAYIDRMLQLEHALKRFGSPL